MKYFSYKETEWAASRQEFDLESSQRRKFSKIFELFVHIQSRHASSIHSHVVLERFYEFFCYSEEGYII